MVRGEIINVKNRFVLSKYHSMDIGDSFGNSSLQCFPNIRIADPDSHLFKEYQIK